MTGSNSSTSTDLKTRCEEVLKGENFDIQSWACPLCPGVEATRAHFVADHILQHIRRREYKREEAKYTRPIEVD